MAGVLSRAKGNPPRNRSQNGMGVVERDVPRHSALGKNLIERADFCHAYCAPLSRSELSVVEIFFGIFGQRPVWMNLMLIARNKAAALAGR
jgi:hypothetical protein